MIRKKHLRERLTKAQADNVKLNNRIGELDFENGQLIDANVDMANRLSAALNANAGLARRLRHFTDVFGEAFVKGGELPPKTGASRPNRKKLTKQDAKDIRDAFYGGAKQKDLARNYGVNPATISRVVRGIYH
ncbi:HTH DNA binding domain protein [Mycobacterium phage Jaan]|nr:HTH DNA binding domain protein [Mycobacterium phage Jaan]